MTEKSGRLRRQLAAILVTAFFAYSVPLGAADLEPQTLSAFHHYVQIAESRMDSAPVGSGTFLWVEGLPAEHRAAALADLRAGKVVIEPLKETDGGKAIAVSGGLIHDWVGTVFIPGATLDETLALEQDYNNHQDYFRPDVMRSQILRHDGNDYTVLLRFYKKKVISVVLDTVHSVRYSRLDATHAASRSHTTRIQQVENAGQADERLEPEGRDDGILWAMNTYWKFEEKDGGTYVESRSISLTRDVPTGLGWMVGPFISSIPRESLAFTLASTRSAVLSRLPPAVRH